MKQKRHIRPEKKVEYMKLFGFGLLACSCIGMLAGILMEYKLIPERIGVPIFLAAYGSIMA